jgi:hypothetical protein
MTNENYNVDILINDKPIRKYPFNNRLFIEARKGQKYSIRIKNNSYNRIMAVASVDGLCVLSGKIASEYGNGYVINGYNSLVIDGFRVSDTQVAEFLFDYKNSSYAATKEDGSEQNVGVIGIRLFQEKTKPGVPPVVIYKEHYHNHDYWYDHPWKTTTPYPNHPTIWSNGMVCSSDTAYGSGLGNDGATTQTGILRAMNGSNLQPAALGFDVGTAWGKAKESRVVEVEFERGILAFTTDIYYASRQSLIEMGVSLGSEKQVSFPEPFVDTKYAIPPKEWKG